MMDRLRNVMRDEALRTQPSDASPRMGKITAYDPNSYSVKAKILPEGEFVDGAEGETGWLPLQTNWVGNGWGELIGPNIGDQVMVLFQEHDAGSGQASRFVFDGTNLPPNPGPPAGERWMIHKNGQLLKFTNDGKILLGANSEIDIGNLGNALKKLVTDAMVDLFNNHVHTNGNGGGNTGKPTSTMGDSQLTSVLKAN
jgi:hypothetical protein